MNSRICIAVVLSLAISGSSLLFPEDLLKSSPAQVDTAYILGAEDQISIHIMDLEEFTERQVRIDPNGFIDLPLVGRMHAAGLTIEQLRSTLCSQVSKYIDSPQITINVLDYRSQPVSVLGAVNNPGLHQLQGPKRILDVVSAAGGIRQDAGPRITITRQIKWGMLPLPGAHRDSSGDYSIAELSIDDLTSGKNASGNIEVRANDVLSISRASLVYVVGEVKKAGGFSLNSSDSISILRALSLAEGLNDHAAPKKARILRAAEGSTTNVNETPINVQEVLAGRAPDMQLRANDILFIPNNVPASAMKRAAEAAIQVATGLTVYGRF